MCHQTTYTLPCEHIRTDIIYCADAPVAETAKKSSSSHLARMAGSGLAGSSGCGGGPSSSPSSSFSVPSKKDGGGGRGGKKNREPAAEDRDTTTTTAAATANGKMRGNSPPKRRPCRNLTSQAIAYPLPPSFEGDPSTAASSPLLPKCPLPRCPFEALNRCWNCCWCAKGWNDQGRCSCVMIIEGNLVRCEHICCETCTPAGAV